MPRCGPVCAAGQAQNGKAPFDTRRFNAMATAKRLLRLRSSSSISPAISSHTARQGGAASPNRVAKPNGYPNGKSQPRQDALATCHRVGEHVGEQRAGIAPRRRIEQRLAGRAFAADPDTVRAGLGLVGGAPIDNNECIEQRFAPLAPHLCWCWLPTYNAS